MRTARFRLLVGLVMVLSACGQVSPTSSTTETASPSPAGSPTSITTPLTVPGPTHHMGEVGLAYTPVSYQATGGNAPYVWSIGNGALPGGLSISPDGVISGTPTDAGTFTFTVEVTDASIATANVSGAINIVPKLMAALIHSGTVTIRRGSGTTGAAFGTQAGGSGPYSYAVTSGSVPTGTRLNGLSLTGTFSAAGNYGFKLTVTDAVGASATISPAYYVWGPIAFPPYLTPSGEPPAAGHMWSYSDAGCQGLTTGCSARFPYSGGTPGITPTVSFLTEECIPLGCTNKPLNGLAVTASGGYVYLSVAPNVNPGRQYGATVVVRLTDPKTHEVTRNAYIAFGP